jgi:chaperonin cofactor prefoldin
VVQEDVESLEAQLKYTKSSKDDLQASLDSLTATYEAELAKNAALTEKLALHDTIEVCHM